MKYATREEARQAQAAKNRQWHAPFSAAALPWRIVTDDGIVACFMFERDARGFAKARYGDEALVEQRVKGYRAGRRWAGTAKEMRAQVQALTAAGALKGKVTR